MAALTLLLADCSLAAAAAACSVVFAAKPPANTYQQPRMGCQMVDGKGGDRATVPAVQALGAWTHGTAVAQRRVERGEGGAM